MSNKILNLLLRKISNLCCFLLRVLIGILKLIFWFIALLLILISITLLYWYWYYNHYSVGGAKFNSKIWKELGKPRSQWDKNLLNKNRDRLSDGINKCKMYNDLTENHLKKGMTVDEVEYLIGKPLSYSYCLEKKIKCANYMLGICWSVPWSTMEWFSVCFDGNNQFIMVDRTHVERMTFFGLGSSNKVGVDEKICNYKIIHCIYGKKKCKCYMDKNQAMGQECLLEIDKW